MKRHFFLFFIDALKRYDLRCMDYLTMYSVIFAFVLNGYFSLRHRLLFFFSYYRLRPFHAQYGAGQNLHYPVRYGGYPAVSGAIPLHR